MKLHSLPKPLQFMIVFALFVAFAVIPASNAIVWAQYQNQPSLIGSVVESDYLLSAGDSVSIEVPFQIGDRRPKGFETAEAIYYEVVCLNIQSEDWRV